jgi:hypothetical protein
MKLARVLGIAAIAALSATALIGVASATAKPTALCLANEDPCAAKNIYEPALYGAASSGSKVKTIITLSGLTGGVTVTCPSGKFLTSHGAPGEPLLGTVYGFSFNSCSECAISVTEPANYSASIEATSAGNGTMSFAKPKLQVNCPGAICYYSNATAKAELEGGKPLVIRLDTVLEKQPGGIGICASTVNLHGVYEQVFVEGLYVTHT